MPPLLTAHAVLVAHVLTVHAVGACATGTVQTRPNVTTTIAARFNALPPVPPPLWKPLEVRWLHALGTKDEGLNTSAGRAPAKMQAVALPHRTLHPETPYWYRTSADLPDPTVWRIRADDGAQLFVNGARVPMKEGVFWVPRGGSRCDILIRVLNKAVYGGLQEVTVASASDYRRFADAQRRRRRLASLVHKVQSLGIADDPRAASVLEAVESETDQAVERAERAMSGQPILVAGPIVQSQGPSRAVLLWQTDVPCRSAVTWQNGSGGGKVTSAARSRTLHRCVIEPIEPGSAVTYRLSIGGREVGPYSFRALPASGSLRVAVWADSQNSWSVFSSIVEQIRRQDPAFIVGVGDLVEDGAGAEPWLSLFRTMDDLPASFPTFLIGGNHEYDECFEDLRSPHLERYSQAQPSPTHFAWTAGNVRCIALDPNRHVPTSIPAGSPEHRWLMKEIVSPEWKRARWRIVFIHQPPYSQGWPQYQGDEPIRALLEPLIEPYGIDVIVSGHTHDYERLTRVYGRQTVHYLIVGGGGGGLEDGPLEPWPVMDRVIREHHYGLFTISGDCLTFEAIGVDGVVLDRLEATKLSPP